MPNANLRARAKSITSSFRLYAETRWEPETRVSVASHIDYANPSIVDMRYADNAPEHCVTHVMRSAYRIDLVMWKNGGDAQNDTIHHASENIQIQRNESKIIR